MAFGVVDYAVFGFSVLFSLIIGIYFARRSRNNDVFDYFTGGRNFRSFQLGISFAVSFQAALLLIGNPVEVYAYGCQFFLLLIPVYAAFVFLAEVAVPIMQPLKIGGIFEYFGLRFNSRSVRILYVCLTLILVFLASAVNIFATALSMEVVTGIPLWGGICILIGSTTLYTTIGGFKAVVATDIFQTVIIWLGVIAVTVKCTIDVGSVGKVFELSRDRLEAFDFSFDPTTRHTVWNLTFGYLFSFLSMVLSGSGIHRIISSPDIKTAKRMIYIGSGFYFVIWTLTIYTGVAIFALYSSQGCDPLASKQLKNVNQLVSVALLSIFENLPGLSGLFMAAVTSATLSSLSSILSASAVMFTEDVFSRFISKVSVSKQLAFAKTFTVACGAFLGLLSFAFSFSSGPIMQVCVRISSISVGPIVAIFFVSFFIKRTTPKGIFMGTFCSIAVTGWLVYGKMTSPNVLKSPMLPFGPVDNCPVIYSDISSSNTSFPLKPLEKSYYTHFASNVTFATTAEPHISVVHVEGVDWLYSISYTLISPIGFLICVTVSTMVSMCQMRGRQVAVDANLLASWKRCKKTESQAQDDEYLGLYTTDRNIESPAKRDIE